MVKGLEAYLKHIDTLKESRHEMYLDGEDTHQVDFGPVSIWMSAAAAKDCQDSMVHVHRAIGNEDTVMVIADYKFGKQIIRYLLVGLLNEQGRIQLAIRHELKVPTYWKGYEPY
ncbi:MAG: hypothetical protein ACFFCO_08675 [Promethearchaeota archaeon]